MPETRDSTWNWEEFIERINSELVGIFGNLCHRTLTFTRKSYGRIPPLSGLVEDDAQALARIEEAQREVSAAYEACEFRRALRGVMSLAQAGNQYFDKKAPWKLIKEDREACGTALHVCLRILQALAVLSAPLVPASAARLWGFLGNDPPISWAGAVGDLPAGRELPEPAILFRKIEPGEIEEGGGGP
jgi:methionyl-tRNA synthetase